MFIEKSGGTVSGNLTVSGTLSNTSITALKLPVGLTTDRPTPLTGHIRYNSTLSQFEGYSGTSWGSLLQTNSTSVTLASANTVLIGSQANTTRFPSTNVVISTTASGIQQNESHIIGLMAEATAHASNVNIYGIGVYGVGYTSATTRSGGVVGEAHVSATTDVGSAIGVRGYSNDTHSGGLNIGLYGDAIGGSASYGLYLNNGDIYTANAKSWVMNGNITFSGAYNVVVPTLNATTSNITTLNSTGTSTLATLNATTSNITTLTTTVLKETKVAMAALDVNISLGNYFTKTITAISTLTVSNVPVTGTVACFILDLTNGGAFAVTWWANMKWAAGTAPTLTTSGRDILGFFTHDAGTTWNGLVLAKDIK